MTQPWHALTKRISYLFHANELNTFEIAAFLRASEPSCREITEATVANELARERDRLAARARVA